MIGTAQRRAVHQSAGVGFGRLAGVGGWPAGIRGVARHRQRRRAQPGTSQAATAIGFLFVCCCAAVLQKRVLKDAKMDKGDVHDVVLVGGSTRIPKVQQLLQVRNDSTAQQDGNHSSTAAAARQQ